MQFLSFWFENYMNVFNSRISLILKALQYYFSFVLWLLKAHLVIDISDV